MIKTIENLAGRIEEARRKGKKEIVSGVITDIEKIHEHLSFVTLEILGEAYKSRRMSFYAELSDEYIGRCVDFKTTERGIISKTIKQEIIGSNFSEKIRLKKSQVEAISKSYINYLPRIRY